MGSTYVRFRGKGYEAWDSQLEVWLHLLVEEIDKLDQPTDWLQEARDEWHLQSTAGFGFGVMPDLDRIVTDEERRSTVLHLCERALSHLERYGEYISKEELNSWQLGDNASFPEEQPTEEFKKVGQYFTKLLQGTLREEECDARFWRAKTIRDVWSYSANQSYAGEKMCYNIREVCSLEECAARVSEQPRQDGLDPNGVAGARSL